MTGTLSQKVIGSFRGKKKTLRFEVELTQKKLAVVALTSLGLPVFSLTYDGTNSTIKTEMKGALLPPPAWILDDILIANAPKAALSNALDRAGYRLDSSPTRRQIIDAEGHTVMHIDYSAPARSSWGSDLKLVDEMLKYRLTVTTLKKTRQATIQ